MLIISKTEDLLLQKIANARRRDNTFKIKFLLIQVKNIDVKVCGDVVTRIRVRRCSIFPALHRNGQYYYYF